MKTGRKKELCFICLGIVLISAGIIFNDFLLAALFSRDGDLETKTRILIRIADLILILGGVLTILFRRSKNIINVYLLIGTLFFFLGVLEIILRVPGWQKRGKYPLKTRDEYLHHSLVPSTRGLNKWGHAEIVYYTNSLGYRDASIREVEKETPADRRILFLGDSFVEGVGVSWEDHFISGLEGLFEQAGDSVEILNAGVASYCPSLEYRKLKQFLDKGYRADVVVLLLDVSDVHDEAIWYKNWEETGPEDPILGSTNMYPMILRELKDRLKPLFIPKSPPGKKNPRPGRYNWTEFVGHNVPWIEEGLETIKDNIRKIANLCRSNGMEFILVIYPQPTQLRSELRPSPAQRIFREFARENDIPLIDLFADFFLLPDWKTYFIPGDIHWNERGHEFVARRLWKELPSGPVHIKEK